MTETIRKALEHLKQRGFVWCCPKGVLEAYKAGAPLVNFGGKPLGMIYMATETNRELESFLDGGPQFPDPLFTNKKEWAEFRDHLDETLRHCPVNTFGGVVLAGRHLVEFQKTNIFLGVYGDTWEEANSKKSDTKQQFRVFLRKRAGKLYKPGWGVSCPVIVKTGMWSESEFRDMYHRIMNKLRHHYHSAEKDPGEIILAAKALRLL